VPLLAVTDLPVQTTAGLEPAFDLVTYYPLFIFLGFVLLFAFGILVAVYTPFLKPKKDTVVKLMPYESGMDPVGDARMQFDIKFYLIAILFLVFDVELLFLYPWATIAYSDNAAPFWRAEFGRLVFIEILVFLLTLGIAYIYAWRKGVFAWR
jgi:NADH:ubiquinone oxidoreductase subunit 3 (subunit A)